MKNIHPSQAYLKFVDTIKKLRDPGGCPWDREQTPQTMRRFLLEETYEVLEAIDKDDASHLCEELGDVILVATMIAQMHSEKNNFTIKDVLENVTEKLIRRHPHIFSEKKVQDSSEVLLNWEKIKKEEKKDVISDKKESSVFDFVPSTFPPLERASKIQEKVERLKLSTSEDPSIQEKIIELIETSKSEKKDPELMLGKLLFLTVNFIRQCGVDSSMALRRANDEFESQFRDFEKNPTESISLIDLI